MNGWQAAEQAGVARPWSTQRLLRAACWDVDGVRDVVLSCAWVERPGEVDAVLALDETGFLTEGNRSGEFGDSGRARRGGLSKPSDGRVLGLYVLARTGAGGEARQCPSSVTDEGHCGSGAADRQVR
ncbi:hypothetical protein ACFXOR_27355 [Streptomyces sp. NPDC059164]|uniref:hypothetical protein n=1 Tax=Streptomyces sp. NPDC059164 TaxID=3346750 RepID=UPI003680D8E3